MPKRRFEKLDLEMRTRILEAAAREFGAHGFAGASLNRIVEQAGISKGSMYYYFEDKADLFDMVLGDLEARSATFIKFPLEDLTAETFWPHVEEAFKAWIRIALETPWIQGFLQLFSEMLRNPPTEGPLVAWHAKMVQRRCDFISRGRKLGVVREDLPLELLSELLNGVQLVLGRFFEKQGGGLLLKDCEQGSSVMIGIARRILLPAKALANEAGPVPAPKKPARKARSASTKKATTRKN